MNGKLTTYRRNSARGKVMGVCAGLADYSGVNAFWWRLGTVILTLSTGGIAILAYVALGIFTRDANSTGGI